MLRKVLLGVIALGVSGLVAGSAMAQCGCGQANAGQNVGAAVQYQPSPAQYQPSNVQYQPSAVQYQPSTVQSAGVPMTAQDQGYRRYSYAPTQVQSNVGGSAMSNFPGGAVVGPIPLQNQNSVRNYNSGYGYYGAADSHADRFLMYRKGDTRRYTPR